MKLQDQVCSVGQAKKLKELGINFGIYSWAKAPDRSGVPEGYYSEIKYLVGGYSIVKRDSNIGSGNPLTWPALTVAELGVMIEDYADAVNRYVLMSGDNAQIVYGEDEEEIWMPTEAQGRAQVLIRAIETGHLEADEVNARLQS
jgi:hypothetical protein